MAQLRSQKATEIDKKLEEARDRATNYGRLYGRFATADDRLKIVYATLMDEAPDGTVDAKASWIRRHEEYIAGVREKENAHADWKAAEVYMKLLLAEVEVWRSNEASNRWVDRAHT